MKKIAFVGNGEPPAKLLEIFKKMTPGRSGTWGELQGTDNYKDADYFMVIDWLPSDSGIDPKKCIFLNAHPETVRPYRDMSGYQCFAKIDAKEGLGFLEWWLSYDYDYLKALEPPTKFKRLGCIMSNADNDKSHILRRQWLKRFCGKLQTNNHPIYFNQQFDLYGRIIPETQAIKNYYKNPLGSSSPQGAAATGGKNDHMSGKEQVYLEYKYMIEFDNIGSHYFSERVLDCMLLWAIPLYWGGNLDVLPCGSFHYIDINGDGEDVLKISNSDFYERNIENLAKAREILLDELQIWPKCHKIIFGSYK